MPIQFPSQTRGGSPLQLEPPVRVVIIGANGSGKTRLGIWLDEKNQGHMPVHRISAQKALSLPEFATVKNLEQAEKDLYYGRSDQHASVDRKVHDRWGGSPATHLLSDYEKLLALLFAREADRDRRYTEQARATKGYVEVPDSPIEQIVALWGYLMPHRAITLRDGKVVVGKGTPNEYHGKEMSDGERVTLYLLGQCLTAVLRKNPIWDELTPLRDRRRAVDDRDVIALVRLVLRSPVDLAGFVVPSATPVTRHQTVERLGVRVRSVGLPS